MATFMYFYVIMVVHIIAANKDVGGGTAIRARSLTLYQYYVYIITIKLL